MAGDAHPRTTVVVVPALSPFSLLAVYAVRVAAVRRRTRAASQFVVDGDALGHSPFE